MVRRRRRSGRVGAPRYDGDPIDLPDGVYEAACSYPVARFSLDEKANKDLAALCRLLDLDADQVTVHFGREAVEQATKLGAAHSSTSAFQSLIVGDDVAAQLAGDYLRAQLKEQRAQQRRAREIDRQPQHAVEVGDEPEGAVSEEQAAERRRAEREARKRAQEEATAYNDELGAAVVKSLSRLRVDERVVKILTAVDLHGCRPLV